jgi:hypothetical protein
MGSPARTQKRRLEHPSAATSAQPAAPAPSAVETDTAIFVEKFATEKWLAKEFVRVTQGEIARSDCKV